MASLVKNSGTYGLIWTDNSRAQPQTRESLKTTDKAKARRLKARLEHEYWHGDHDPWRRKWYQRETDGGAARLADVIEEFIKYKSRARGQSGWSHPTANRESSVLRKFARLTGKTKYLSEVTAKDLESFYYRDSVTSDHTRHSDYISLNTLFNWAIERGHLTDKPHFKPNKPQSKVPKFIQPSELAALIRWKLRQIEDNIKGNHLYEETDGAYWVPLGWMVLAGTGMRPKELVNLKLNDVHSRAIIIGEGFITKTRAERRIPLLYESWQATQLLTDRRFRKLGGLHKSPMLLGRKPNYAQNKISRDFTDAWEDVFPDKPKRTLYNLKDFFAVRFLYSEEGGNINDLANILGHASLDTTRRYLKAVPYGVRLEGTIWDFPTVSRE